MAFPIKYRNFSVKNFSINNVKTLIAEGIHDNDNTMLSASNVKWNDDSTLNNPRLGVTVTTLTSFTTDKMPLVRWC